MGTGPVRELECTNRFVSLCTFRLLFDQYSDFCKKLRFLVKGAFTIQEETLALEMISEYLDRKETQLGEFTAHLSGEAIEGKPEAEAVEVLLGRYLMQHEDYRMLQRIAEIRRKGGARWEKLQALIQDGLSPEPEGRR